MKRIIYYGLYWFIVQMIIAQLGTRISHKCLKKIIYTLEVGILKKKVNYGKNWLKFNIEIGKDYPETLVDLKLSREFVMNKFKSFR